MPDGRKVVIKSFNNIPEPKRMKRGESPASGITELLSKLKKKQMAIIPPRGDEGDLPVRVYNGTVRQFCKVNNVKIILRSLDRGRVGVYRVA
jgi:hypothetical protein